MDILARVLAQKARMNANTHKADETNPHLVDKTQVGLGNVDNIKQAPLSLVGDSIFTDQNYVTNDESITNNIDVLDIETKAINDRAGTLANLTTTDKSNLVGAINEVSEETVRSASLVVASNDSLHKERADYVCDGVSDQVEIQAAIDSLHSGGKVLLSEGVFYLTDEIKLNKPGVILEGMGKHSTFIRAQSASMNLMHLDAHSVEVANLQLDGNESLSVGGIYQYWGAPYYGFAMRSIVVKNFWGDGAGAGNAPIYLANCNDILMHDVSISNVRAASLVHFGSSVDIKISDSVFVGTGKIAPSIFVIDNCKNTKIINSLIDTSAGTGIHFIGGSLNRVTASFFINQEVCVTLEDTQHIQIALNTEEDTVTEFLVETGTSDNNSIIYNILSSNKPITTIGANTTVV